jgi:hypothetical protein
MKSFLSYRRSISALIEKGSELVGGCSIEYMVSQSLNNCILLRRVGDNFFVDLYKKIGGDFLIRDFELIKSTKLE